MSGPDDSQAEVTVVRMGSGEYEALPGYAYTPIVADVNGSYACESHPVNPGGYGFSSFSLSDGDAGMCLQLLFCPTLLDGTQQTLVQLSSGSAGQTLELMIDTDGFVCVRVADGDGTSMIGSLGVGCDAWSWYKAIVSWRGDGRVVVKLYALSDARMLGELNLTVAALTPGAWGSARIVVAGSITSDGGSPDLAFSVQDHFNGRVEQVALLQRADFEPSELAILCESGRPVGDFPEEIRSALAAMWDFSLDIERFEVPNLVPAGCSMVLRNLPRRGVTGSRYLEGSDGWMQDPSSFGAVHFLKDGLEDCQWPALVRWSTPEFLRSGFYAFRIDCAGETTFVPFFVSQQVGNVRSRVAVLAPVATYLSYGNSRFWWEDPIQEAVSDRLVELGPEDLYLILHPELAPSSYDTHLDGTDVTHVSFLRPNLFMSPSNRHLEGYCSDLKLIEWLERVGVDYDVITDSDLHFRGHDALENRSVVITGTHPEYVSIEEFDALHQFQDEGGRLMYLGGNGFQTRITFHPERLGVMENRRVDYWKSAHPGVQAEVYLATDGLAGGHLDKLGRSALQLLGVQSVTMGFDESKPYHRSPDLPIEAEFVFQGVESYQFGDFGSLGGGVVGQEWDNSAGGPLPEGYVKLASSKDHSIIPALFGAVTEPYNADMALVLRRSGGAVFSASSMTWCAGLDHNHYDNDCAKITENVLRQFMNSL